MNDNDIIHVRINTEDKNKFVNLCKKRNTTTSKSIKSFITEQIRQEEGEQWLMQVADQENQQN